MFACLFYLCDPLYFYFALSPDRRALPKPLFSPSGKSAIHAASGQSVHVGSKRILQVADFGDHLFLIGKKAGETHLIIGQKIYLVEVVPRPLDVFQKKLDSLFEERIGTLNGDPEWKIASARAKLYRFEDWLEIAEVAREEPIEYDFAAKPLNDVAEEAIAHFVSRARAVGLPLPKLVLDGGLKDEPAAGSDGYLALANKTFSPFGIKAMVTPSQVPIAPLVRTSVILAEMSRQVSRTFGLQWPETYQAKVLPNWEPAADLMVELKALESKGLGKVLASPTLLCKSGSAAEFLAGGELPIRTSRLFGGEFLWKKHGVVLKVKPVAVPPAR